MQWDDLFRALALVMIIEGLMPFVAPRQWREMLVRIASQIDERSLRMFGGTMIGLGMIGLHMLRLN